MRVKSSPDNIVKRLRVFFGVIAAASLLGAVPTAAEDLIDCPLRDAPYSIDTPLMDILLKPEAVAVVNRHMDDALDKMPEQFVSSRAPSFSAILDLRKLAGLAGIPQDALPPIDRELAQLTVTDADRRLRCARYDTAAPELVIPDGSPRVLLFEKMTGFRDGPSVEAATLALQTMAEQQGWALVRSDNGAVMSPGLLEQFDVVLWNNISGDVLTLTQREVFRGYIEGGGGYVGIHGSGGDPMYLWDWYVDDLLGARFIGHPRDPQFQQATVQITGNASGIGRGMPPGFRMTDEWYSFAPNPGETGAMVVASLDESSYVPGDYHGRDLRMGEHPIAWARCVGDGRSFYSAIGHRPETYSDPNHLELLRQGIEWAAGEAGGCLAQQ